MPPTCTQRNAFDIIIIILVIVHISMHAHTHIRVQAQIDTFRLIPIRFDDLYVSLLVKCVRARETCGMERLFV